MTENEISGQIIDAALKIHRAIGPGLLESVYRTFLAHELALRGLRVDRECSIPATYEGLLIETAYRVDLMVNDKVIVEIKSIEEVHSVHKKQVLTYLKLSRKKLGLLLNFNVSLMKGGIIRIVNGLPETA